MCRGGRAQNVALSKSYLSSAQKKVLNMLGCEVIAASGVSCQQNVGLIS